MNSNGFYLKEDEVRPPSPHGLHNYLYNVYDRWDHLYPAFEGQSTKDVYFKKPMVENCHSNSEFANDANLSLVNNFVPGDEPLDLSKNCNREKRMADNHNDMANTCYVKQSTVDDYYLNGQPYHLYREDVLMMDSCSFGSRSFLEIVKPLEGNLSHDDVPMMDGCSFNNSTQPYIETLGNSRPRHDDVLMMDCCSSNTVQPNNHDDVLMMDCCSSNTVQPNNHDVNQVVVLKAGQSVMRNQNIGHIDVPCKHTEGYVLDLTKDASSEEIVFPHSIELTQIENTMNFSDLKGYVYSLNNYTAEMKNLYFRCKNSSGVHRCTARAKAKNRNLKLAVLTSAHTHFPDENILQSTKFDGILDETIESNKYMSTRELYFKAREKVPDDKVQFIPLRSSKGSYIHRRKIELPKIPKTIDEFEELINREEFKSRYCLDARKNTFYRGVWNDKNGNKMVVFISESGLQVLRELSVIELLMDGTFKVLPRHIEFCQLYVISFMYEARCYPFVFVFMEKRDSDAYDLLFRNLVAMITPECAAKVSNCMSDYEHAVRKMCRVHFPYARIGGCLFHYVKAMNKRARKSGLSKDVQFQQPIRELCALALLPNDFMANGFEVVVKKTADSPKWILFRNYWRRTWLNANISVYGLKNRTDNYSEAFNRSFNLLNGKPHQNIWIVLKNLKQMEMDKTDELLKHRKGKMFVKRADKIAEKLNAKIQLATTRFEETEDVERFLENITQDEDIQKACMQNHLLEDCVDDIEDDIENEEFIANDFDANSNFQKIQKPTVNWKRKAEQHNNNLTVQPDKMAKVTKKHESIALFRNANKGTSVQVIKKVTKRKVYRK